MQPGIGLLTCTAPNAVRRKCRRAKYAPLATPPKAGGAMTGILYMPIILAVIAVDGLRLAGQGGHVGEKLVEGRVLAIVLVLRLRG